MEETMVKQFEHSEVCVICGGNDLEIIGADQECESYPWNHVDCGDCGASYMEDETAVKRPRVVWVPPCIDAKLSPGRDSYEIINKEDNQ